MLFVAMKLKYHRLKPGGVQRQWMLFVAMKLKYHRLKPVVSTTVDALCSYEVEVPPAKAGGVETPNKPIVQSVDRMRSLVGLRSRGW